MKRSSPTMSSSSSSSSSQSSSSTSKKPKFTAPEPDHHTTTTTNNFDKLDDNLLYEVLKHADAKTLATASCVSTQWRTTAQDERLWELICTRHWSTTVNCGTHQLRSVVLALGGFRRLYALYLSKTSAASSAAAPVVPVQSRVMKGGGSRLGKDEVNLSLSLLSIRFYEKMNGTINKKKL